MLKEIFKFSLVVYVTIILLFVTIILIGVIVHYLPAIWGWLGVLP